jgi:hypothetical protein
MLSEILNAADRRGETVLVNADGEPFSAKSLTGMMAHWCELAGLPKGLTLHGLRKSLGVYLAVMLRAERTALNFLCHLRAGGGSNHRFGLDDAILIKDNHIAIAGGIVMDPLADFDSSVGVMTSRTSSSPGPQYR